MMSTAKKIKSTFVVLVAASGMTVAMSGCGLLEGAAPLPFGQITMVQLFDQPNFTVALSVESAVTDPTQVAKVNWVFGDGSGFQSGPPNVRTITHRYPASGPFDVTAFIFDANGFVDQILTRIVVAPNDQGQPPGPDNGPPATDLPSTISSPSPVDGAQDVSVDATLAWFAGLLTESHDVYLGTVQADVENADNTDPVNFRGNQTDTQFDPMGLMPDTEYFWRVDEVNAAGTTKGTVFSFRTAVAAMMAEMPVPTNASTAARVDQVLQWVAGDGATSHDVYFGKDLAAVTNATTDDANIFQGNQSATSFDPADDMAVINGQLLPNTDYFWRIDEVGPGGTATGTVWSFRTQAAPPKIMTPVPADLATDVGVTQILSWTASPSIESFDVYLGFGMVDVADATTNSAEFQGNQTAKNFDPAALVFGGAQFFWRIDTLGPGGTTKGDVLSFTTASPPGQVSGPFTPANAASNVDIETMLQWNAGSGNTTRFEVFLSTDSNAVQNGAASALQSSQDAALTTFQPTSPLMPGTVYFWSVNAIGPGGTTAGQVLSFTTGNQPQKVENPDPTIGATAVALDKSLGWMASVGTTSYDVYFDTNQQAVQNADDQSTEFRGNVGGTSFVPGALFPDGLLDGDTQYFWRIDAKGPGGTTTGDVWNFTTGPNRATDPMPMKDETGVDVNSQLSWSASGSASSFDVYLGTDETAVTNADPMSAEFQGNVSVTNFDPGGLMSITDYYWRIDTVDDTGTGGTTKGEVWKFTTGAGQATMPTPANGASGVSLTPMLDWTVGSGAVDQDIFFGTNQTAVDNADRSSSVFQGTFPVAAGPPPFNPSPLSGITAYFWRIDSVTADGTTKGEVWQFITGPAKATGPMPANFATDVSLSTLLQWTAGNGAVTHDVYFISEADYMALPMGQRIANADNTISPPFVSNAAITTFDPGALAADTVYLWRIDEIAADGTTITKGDVWRFTTLGPPQQSGSPSPVNGATDVDLTPTLNWAAADGATSYDVYFGTDMMNPAFQGNQASRSFSPGTLTASTTYYWRIDAVNDAGATTGVIWSFTTMP